ncbi:hypothetical protein LN650_19040 [Klebsiella pneumoniae subsp. pneumoniae]|nr:hypothetical protein [Klebsiella pneumoniae subsp. pneumoniae]
MNDPDFDFAGGSRSAAGQYRGDYGFSQAWHPASGAGPGHRWLRQRVREGVSRVKKARTIAGKNTGSNVSNVVLNT